MKESETTAIPDPRGLTMEEIREGVGGFSMDPTVIPDAQLRTFMTEVSGYLSTKDTDIHVVSETMNAFYLELEAPNALIRSRLDGIRNRHYIYFHNIPNGMISLKINLEAALAFLFTRKKINSYHNNKYSRVEDSIGETRNNLGNYYAVIPFLKNGDKTPEYEKEARIEIEKRRQEVIDEYDKAEEIIKVKNDLLEQSIINPTFDDLQSLSGIGCDFVDSKIKKIEAEMEKKQLDSLFGEVSWGRLEMFEGVARTTLFIDYAHRHILSDFDRLEENMTYPQLLRAFRTVRVYMDKYPKLNRLDKLYEVVAKAVRKDPQVYFHSEKKGQS